MGLAHGVNIVRDGLVFSTDPANPRSYPRSGTTSTDLINNINGTLQSSGMFETDNAGVFDFDGETNTIQFSTTISINSVSLWFKPNSTITTSTSNGCPISFGTTDFRNAIYLGSNFGAIQNELIIIMDQSINRSYYAQSGGSISASWHHLVIVHDGTKYQIYLDGSALTTTGSTSLITSQQILIGARSDSSSYYNGKISSIQIYNRALSASEVKQNYNALKGRFGL